MNKYIVSVLLLLGICVVSFSQTDTLKTSTFMSADEMKRAANGEMISRMYVKYNARGENTDMGIDIPRTKYADEDFFPYEILVDEKSFLSYELNDVSKLKMFNTFLSFSKSKGMIYYSRSAGKNETLIKDCFRVESEKSKQELPDVEYDKVQSKVVSYFLQQDNKFGKLNFKSELFNEGDNFVVKNTCMQAIANTNKPGEFKTITYLIYDSTAKGYYVYTLTAIRIRNDLLTKMGLLRPTTFSNRLRASTVHLAKLLGLDWESKLNPWDETKLKNGEYKNF